MLENIYLYGNQLTGSIPPELGSLADLQNLNLSGNRLDGPIPTVLGDLANLQNLSLGNNQLTGAIPSELGNPGQPADPRPVLQPTDRYHSI